MFICNNLEATKDFWKNREREVATFTTKIENAEIKLSLFSSTDKTVISLNGGREVYDFSEERIKKQYDVNDLLQLIEYFGNLNDVYALDIKLQKYYYFHFSIIKNGITVFQEKLHNDFNIEKMSNDSLESEMNIFAYELYQNYKRKQAKL